MSKSDLNKLSYAIGMSLGQSMASSGIKDVDFEDFLKGVKVVFEKGQPEISVDEGNQILKTYFENIQREQKIKENEERAAALLESEEYLKKSADAEGVKITATGLQYKVISEGNGQQPTAHSRVRVHYEGRLTDGTVFDSSYQRQKPAEFGLDQVIAGWTEGLQLMKEGSVYELTIPPQLGYGEVGIPGHIPGNSVLIFKVELQKVL